LRGKEIHAEGKKVGKVDSVVLDWQTGAATAVLDLDRSFTGTNEKFMISVQELSIQREDQDTIVTNLSRADFQPFARPRTGSTDARIAPTGRTDTVERPSTSATRDQVETRTLGDRRIDDRRTSPVSADPRSVALPQTEVSPMLESAARSARQNIANHPSLEGADVEVVPYNDMLVVRGFADSDEMKKRIEDAVRQGARGVNMESHILIRQR
jgi:sporulation protein YlmC with PRC-barrel domain